MARLGVGTEAVRLRVEVPEDSSQRLLKRSGVVLKRGNYLEGDVAVQLFLKDSGTTWVYIPGAGRGSQRFGGALEPLIWGKYQLYQSKRRMYLKEVEVIEDFWSLRSLPRSMLQAIQWTHLFNKYFIEGYPYNAVLALFYWGEKALSEKVPPEIVDARLLWRWLYDWGIAPDFQRCSKCGRPLNGRGAWMEGAFICESCRIDGEVYEFDEFSRYAMSASFTPGNNTDRLLKQSRSLRGLFVRNFDDNR